MIPVLAAYAVAVVLLSPYLYYMFAFGHAGGSVLDPVLFGADLLSFVIPHSDQRTGRLAPIAAVASTFLASLTETTSYLALPLIAIAGLFARARFREPVGRLLVELLIILCVLALGSRISDRGSSDDRRAVDALAAISVAQQDSAGAPDGIRLPGARDNRGDVARRARRSPVAQMGVGLALVRSCCPICRRDSGRLLSIPRVFFRPASIGNTLRRMRS